MNSARRIASLISSATEMLYLLGLEERVVGVSHECDYPPSVSAKPRLTHSLVESSASSRTIDDQVRELSSQQMALYSIDRELLARLQPDLIITQAQCDVCAIRYADVMQAVQESPILADAEVLPLNPSRLTDVFADIRRVAAAAGVEDRAEQVIASLEARVRRVRDVTDGLTSQQRPRVACLEWIDPPMLAANWTPELVHWAGGNDGLNRDGRHSTYASWNDITEFDPEILVILPCGFELRRAIVEAQVLPLLPQWSALTAVRAGRVFAADGNAFFNRSGPRLVDSLEILAHLFHPDRFAPPLAEPQRAWQRLSTLGNRLISEEP